MTTLVVGATGATGSLLVKELLKKNQKVKAIIRSPDKVPDAVKNNPNFSYLQASLLDLTDEELQEQVKDCDAIASCLGHTLKGIYGPPRRLVTDATRRLCDAAKASNSEKPVKFVLMNTSIQTMNRQQTICVLKLIEMGNQLNGWLFVLMI